MTKDNSLRKTTTPHGQPRPTATLALADILGDASEYDEIAIGIRTDPQLRKAFRLGRLLATLNAAANDFDPADIEAAPYAAFDFDFDQRPENERGQEAQR